MRENDVLKDQFSSYQLDIFKGKQFRQTKFKSSEQIKNIKKNIDQLANESTCIRKTQQIQQDFAKECVKKQKKLILQQQEQILKVQKCKVLQVKNRDLCHLQVQNYGQLNYALTINQVNESNPQQNYLFDKTINFVQQKNYNKINKQGSLNHINIFNLPQINQKKKLTNFISLHHQYKKQTIAQILVKHNLGMYFKEDQISYPIPDHIFTNCSIQNYDFDMIKNIKAQKLPNGFSCLIQMLNIYYLFPQVFKLEQETLNKITEILQAPLQIEKQTETHIQYLLNNLLHGDFQSYLSRFINLIIHDLNSQRLQSIINQQKTYNILSLVKFCQENQLLQFVLKYNWPLIVQQILKISSENQNTPNQNQLVNLKTKYQKIVSYIKQCVFNRNFVIPENFQLKFQIISVLIDSYSKTNSFRELFNKKIQTNRSLNKKKNELQEEKRNLEQSIKKLNFIKQKKSKKIQKPQKKKKKVEQKQSDNQIEQMSNHKNHKNHNKQQNEHQQNNQKDHNEQIQKILQKIEQINQQIQNQNRLQSFSCAHYLGKDMNQNLYWFINYFPEKLFIEKPDSSWFYFSIEKVYYLTQYLNKRAINQNRLLQKIHLYFKNSLYRFQCKMEIQTNEYNAIPSTNAHIPGFSQISQKNIINNIINKNQKNYNGLNNLDGQQIDQQNDSSKNSGQNNELLIGLGQFKIDKNSLFRMIQIAQRKMTQYLKDRNSRWGNQQNKQLLFQTVKSSDPNWLQEAKKQIALFNQKICVVEIQYKVFVQQSTEQVDSKIKKIQTKIWGINEKYKHNWYDFINSCSNFYDLFFAVTILYALVKKYTSKHRKLRKQYEEIKQKTVWRTTTGIKQWRKNWNQICQVCGSVGQVLCCDYCPKVYHLECINLSTIPADEYKCKSCKQQIITRNQLKSLSHDKKKARNQGKLLKPSFLKSNNFDEVQKS